MYPGKPFKVASSSTFPTEGTEKGLVCEEGSEDSGGQVHRVVVVPGVSLSKGHVSVMACR